MKLAQADPDSSPDALTQLAAAAGSNLINLAGLQTSFSGFNDNIAAALQALHDEVNDLKAKLRSAGILDE